MGRFLFGVLFAFGLWWGYDRFFRSDAAAAESPPTVGGAAQLSAVDDERLPEDPERPDGRGGDPVSAPGSGFGAALRANGAERDRLIAAAVREVRASAAPREAVERLGPDNAFLHLPEGRELALDVVAVCERLPAQEAVRETTRLLELGMNGPLEVEHAEARAAFERLAARHASLVGQTVFNPADMTGARRYEMQKGDHLIGIARHMRDSLDLKVEAGTLQVVNGIANPRSLQAGRVLKIPVEPIRTVIRKRAFILAVYVGDVIVRTYRCAHGKPNVVGQQDPTETPTGSFVIGKKIEDPDWHHDGRVVAFGDPNNPLGRRFVEFRHPTYAGLGAHGTTQPQSIGTRASLGCVRLGEAEILDFFLLVPRESDVEILD